MIVDVHKKRKPLASDNVHFTAFYSICLLLEFHDFTVQTHKALGAA